MIEGVNALVRNPGVLERAGWEEEICVYIYFLLLKRNVLVIVNA